MASSLPYYFDRVDEDIVKALQKEPAHSSILAKRLSVPRTTIAYRLSRLAERKLVIARTRGRKVVWQIATSPDHLAPDETVVYRGDEITKAYSLLLTLPKDSIIWSIQGAEAAKSELSFLPASFIKEAHRIFKRRRYVMKGISNTAAVRDLERVDTSLLQSHIGRTIGVKMFTNGLFVESGEIFVTDGLLLLVNPSKRVALATKDEGIIAAVKDICGLLYDLLENMSTFDINKHLESMLSKQ